MVSSIFAAGDTQARTSEANQLTTDQRESDGDWHKFEEYRLSNRSSASYSTKDSGTPSLAMEHIYPDEPEREMTAKHEASSIGRLLLIALVGMLTAGWFLSRALSIWLFMYFGMVFAASRMGRDIDRGKSGVAFYRIVKWSVAGTAAAISMMYVILRARNLVAH